MGIGRKRLLSLAALAAVATAAVAALPGASRATTAASVTLSAGGFALVNGAPAAAISFPTATLDGTNQTVTVTLPFDIGDATGSGSGWNLTATSTTFTSGSHTLPTTATTIQAPPTASCDAGAAGCATAITTVSFPYALRAAMTAPAATKLFDAAPSTGIGNQTFTSTWTLTIPANAVASGATYSSTWTFSLVSGP
jgi:putative surface cell wall-binding protein